MTIRFFHEAINIFHGAFIEKQRVCLVSDFKSYFLAF